MAIFIYVLACMFVVDVTAFSKGDCVCNAAGDTCGAVTAVGQSSVTIWDAVTKTVLLNDNAVVNDQSACLSAYVSDQCLCVEEETTLYTLSDDVLVVIGTTPAGTCFYTTGISTEPGTPGVFDYLYRSDTQEAFYVERGKAIFDPSRGRCCPDEECTDPVPEINSTSCTAVFLDQTPSVYGKYGDRCYYGFDVPFKYQAAQDFCQETGLRLVWVETDDEAEKIFNITEFPEYWVGLEKSTGVWQWVSTGSPVDATADVDGRFKGGKGNDKFERAAIQMDLDNFPLKGLPETASKSFICEETVPCKGTHVSVTISLVLSIAYIAVAICHL